MTKKEMIKSVVEGHMENVTEWALRDRASLRAWITDILDIKRMTKAQIQEEFSVYLEDDIDDDTIISLTKKGMRATDPKRESEQ